MVSTPALCAECPAASSDAITKGISSPAREVESAATLDKDDGFVAVEETTTCEVVDSPSMRWDVVFPTLLKPDVAAADVKSRADERVPAADVVEDIRFDEESLAVALALPVTTAKPDGPGPIPTADESTSPRNAMKAWSGISGVSLSDV